jgi:hypothetical protein
MPSRKPKPNTSVVPSNNKRQLPTTGGSGRGFEEADVDSYAIPFLTVLQKSTPWADPDDDAYIKGAKAGMFINTVTLDLFDEVEVIPCAFQRRFNRWAPRDAGGGFKGMFLPSQIPAMEANGSIKQSEEGRWYFPMPDGTINEKKCDVLTDTRMHYCRLLGDGGENQPVLVSLSRTQLKKSKQWMTLMQQRGGDMFSSVYTAKTRDEENDKGKWKGWVISALRAATEEEVAEAVAFYAAVMGGKVQVKMEREGE